MVKIHDNWDLTRDDTCRICGKQKESLAHLLTTGACAEILLHSLLRWLRTSRWEFILWCDKLWYKCCVCVCVCGQLVTDV